MGDWKKHLPSLNEIRAAARAHWQQGAVVGGSLFVAIAVVTFLLPRTYYSEAKLLVKSGGWENTVDASGSTGQSVNYFEPRENEINSILEVLRSRDVTEGVVDVLGLDALLHGGAIPEISAEKVQPHDPNADRSAARQQAVAMLEKNVQAWIPKRANTINLRAEAPSPQLAQAINAAYLAVYQKVHADVNSTKGSFEFFAEQQRQLREKWEQATGELRDAKDQLGVSTLIGRRTTLESQLNDVQKNLLADEAEMAAAIGRIASLEKKLAETPTFTETTRAENANAAADVMRGNLYTLQMKQKELLSRYTDQHPLARDLNEQVAELEKLLAKEGRTRVQSTSAINPAWSQLESSLLNESSRRDSLTAGIQELKQQQENLLGQLRHLNNDEIRLGQLQQTAEVAEKSCLETSQRLEQARIHRELAQERITNVNVFQEPSFVAQAIAPKRTFILALGALVSALAGAGTIAGCAYLRRFFASLDDLSQRLQLPVIAAFRSPLRTAM